MRLFDTHAHYDDAAFDADRDGLLSSLPGKGIGLVVNAGADEASSRAAVELSKRYGFIYSAVGIHPHEAAKAEAGWQERIEALSKDGKCRAIGEIGLDYHYDFSPRDVQKSIFDGQLSMAESLGLPVVIHEREAFADAIDILKGHAGIKGVFHCFSGNRETAKVVLGMGFYISLGGAITFKNAKKPPEVMAYVPDDRIMLETDCPYMTPAPYRGKRNDSSYLSVTAETAARLRGCTVQEIAELTFKNGKEFFGIK
jgi:TatD DNase family protein